MTQEEYYQAISERAKEIRSINDQYDKRIIEYSKGSIEFSKLLVTNLHLINAGGLLATPTLAKFFGFETAQLKAQVLIVTLPPMSFLLGLIAAAVCALATYRNFQKHALGEQITKAEEVARARSHFPLLPGEEPYTTFEQDMTSNANLRKKTNKSIQRTYVTGLLSGALSIALFAAGCSVYGAVLLLPIIRGFS